MMDALITRRDFLGSTLLASGSSAELYIEWCRDNFASDAFSFALVPEVEANLGR